MSEFNGNVSDSLNWMVARICNDPDTWVGCASVERVAMFLDGYTYSMLSGSGEHILRDYFRKFLLRKYGYDQHGLLWSNVPWWSIYKNHFKDKEDRTILSVFREDFDQFSGPLTRMAIEVD